MRATSLRLRLRQGVSALVVVAMLGGCVTTQAQRIGPDDPADTCRQYVVALDSTGNFFAEDMIKGALIGAVGGAVLGGLFGGGRGSAIAIGAATGAAAGAATGYIYALQQQSRDQAVLAGRVSTDLSKENAEIDRTQLAFDQLSDCRFRQAQAVRADVAAGRLTRDQGQARLAQLRGWWNRDIALARQINEKMATRGAEYETAAETLSPGTKDVIAQQKAAPPPRRAVVRRATPVLLRPDPAAPQVAALGAREQVTVARSQGSYALVETSAGARGYAPAGTLQVEGRAPTRAAQPAGSDVRGLAATNVAKRDNFATSVQVAEAATGSGFELTS
ncbi:YMGG-like glycine zipper-containing protein [Elioraea sp.]|uniref:YMGG-like glycine zipper-containing protein n=1 Tax=Elioraea sp. TaxID=2185103 RepID=UPI003F6F9DD8